jgi:SAM-dependent methyltransferase
MFLLNSITMEKWIYNNFSWNFFLYISINISMDLVANRTTNLLLEAEESRGNMSKYYADMDASMITKVETLTPHINENVKVFYDIGTGTGKLLIELWKIYNELYPDIVYIGTDMMEKSITYCNDKLSTFVAEYPNAAGKIRYMKTTADEEFSEKGDILFYSSIFHEIYSYEDVGGKNPFESELARIKAVENALTVAYNNLKEGGRIIIRDFCRPVDGSKKVYLYTNNEPETDDCMSFIDFHSRRYDGQLGKFKMVDYNLSRKLDDLNSEGGALYETNMQTAYEYLFRKDYCGNDLETELHERYGFWTEESACQLLNKAGFTVVNHDRINNNWIIQNRLNGTYLFDDSGFIGIPKYQMVIVGSTPGPIMGSPALSVSSSGTSSAGGGYSIRKNKRRLVKKNTRRTKRH